MNSYKPYLFFETSASARAGHYNLIWSDFYLQESFLSLFSKNMPAGLKLCIATPTPANAVEAPHRI